MKRIRNVFQKVSKQQSEDKKSDTTSMPTPNTTTSNRESGACSFISPDKLFSSPGPSNTRHTISTEMVGLPVSIFSDDIHGQFEMDLGDINSGPVRPVLSSYPLSQFGKQHRSFSEIYLKQYHWLEYSKRKDAVFCYACRIFEKSFPSEDTFIKSGFRNWKKIKEKLDKHEKSKSHSACMEKYAMHESSKERGSVMSMISSAHREEVERNIEYLSKVFDIIMLLGRQGLSLRGHDERKESNNRGNFLEFCEVFAQHDNAFKESFEKNITFCSKTIQNEVINIISTLLLEQIVNEVKNCNFFCYYS